MYTLKTTDEQENYLSKLNEGEVQAALESKLEELVNLGKLRVHQEIISNYEKAPNDKKQEIDTIISEVKEIPMEEVDLEE